MNDQTDERSEMYRARLMTDFQTQLQSALGGYTFGLHPGLTEVLVDSAMGAIDQLLDEAAEAPTPEVTQPAYPAKPDVLRAGEALRTRARGTW